jgi:hypothetical protein
MKVTPKY